jgi:uncharacterized protein YcfJ
MRVGSSVLAAMSLVLAAAGPAAAQPFTELEGTLKPGETVFVTDASGAEVRGEVSGVQPSALRLRVDGIEREWALDDVREVHRRRDSAINGTIIGAVAGGVLGSVGGWMLGREFANEGGKFTGPFVTVLALGAAGGAFVGNTIDLLIPGRTLLYRQSRAVVVSSLVSPIAQGVVFSLRF